MQLARCCTVLAFCGALLGSPGLGRAERPTAPSMGIFTKPGAVIDASLLFVDSGGSTVALRDLIIPEKPFILVPTFYRCPRLCSLTFSGLLEYISQSKLRLGKDYTIIAYSFNPAEGPAVAREKSDGILSQVAQEARSEGWRFLTGSQDSISTLNRQLDFRIRMADKEFEHSSAIFVFGPEGRLRRYFAGVEFPVDRVDSALGGGSDG